jgi:tetratricopeptide (TPR) repeat protein
LSAQEEWERGLDTESLGQMEEIAKAYRRRGLYRDAETILQKVFEAREQKLGTDHPEMAYYHNDLGRLQAEQGKYAGAEAHYLRAIAITAT